MKPASKKKLLIVTDYYYPHWTGISKSLWYMTQYLDNSFEITILTTQHDKKLPLKEKQGSILIRRIPPTFSFSRTYFSIAFIPVFLSLIMKQDIVLINSPCTYILPVSILTKLYGKKNMSFHQGDLILPKGIINRLVEKIFDISTVIGFSLMDKVATYTEDYALQSRVLKPFMHKFTPLIMPIPSPLSLQTSDTEVILKQLKKQKKILFGFAGRFVEEKGFDILFRAIPHIVKELPQAYFVFAGETKMGYENFFEKKRKLFEKIKTNALLLGLLNESRLASFYKHIDFVVLPSRSDCFGLVQAEAMIAGKPAIVTNIPGLRVPVNATNFGLTFTKNDSFSLAACAIQIVKQKQNIMKNYKSALLFFNNTVNAKAIKEYLTK